MLNVLLLFALVVVVPLVVTVVVLGLTRSERSRRVHRASDPRATADARASKLAAEQAVIQRQGGQGAGHGGVGGGMGF